MVRRWHRHSTSGAEEPNLPCPGPPSGPVPVPSARPRAHCDPGPRGHTSSPPASPPRPHHRRPPKSTPAASHSAIPQARSTAFITDDCAPAAVRRGGGRRGGPEAKNKVRVPQIGRPLRTSSVNFIALLRTRSLMWGGGGAGYGRPVDRGACTVKRPRQQPAHPPICQLLGAADAQTAHPATFSTVPTHQLLGSANAETTPAGAPAAAVDTKQRPDATCEGTNG